MCGFFGHVSLSNSNTMNLENYNCSVLELRGPDEINKHKINNIKVEHYRLSTYGGQENRQPVIDSQTNSFCIFNGQIYNYQKLAHRSTSPVTEGQAILQHLMLKGELGLRDLDGPFAIALYDDRKNYLYLARDRWGEKPLYYKYDNDGFYYSSSLIALTSLSSSGAINFDALNAILTVNTSPPPDTIVKDIFQIIPGHYIAINCCPPSDGKFSFSQQAFITKGLTGQKYWPSEKLIDQIDQTLFDAVESRMRGDSKISLALSGGVDSSLIAAYAAQVNRSTTSTVSLAINDPSYDESIYSEKIASSLRLDNTTIHCTNEKLAQSFLDITSKSDTPLTDPAAILLNIICNEVSASGSTILFTGDGADEIFMGYRLFEYQWMKSHSRIRFLLFQMALRAAALTSESNRNLNISYVAKKLLNLSKLHPLYHVYNVNAAFQPSSGLGAEELNDYYSKILRLPLTDHVPPLEQIRSSMISHYLCEQQTQKIDRCAAINSIDIRCPFLANDITSLALSLPPSVLVHNRGKIPLRTLLNRHMNISSPLQVKKKGFRLPLGQLLRNELSGVVQTELLDGCNPLHSIVSKKNIQDQLRSHMSSSSDHSKAIFVLYSLSKWVKNNPVS